MKADAALSETAVGRLRASRGLAYLLGIAAALTLTVALVVAVMRPPMNDLAVLALLFGLTGGGSAVIGFASHRLGWWRRFRHLSQTLTLGYVVAAGLTLLNVWLTARLMFLNPHDLALAGLLLLFAGGISVSFGYFLSTSLTATLGDLVRAAGQVSAGDFTPRVPVEGHDEVAQLASAFNQMAQRLALAEAEARALDAARRDLVAWASHDLRTPLTSLRAMLAALAEGVVTEPDAVARYLQQSQAEISRLSALTDDLFEMAQMDAGHLELRPELASLGDLISDTLEGFSARAQAQGVRLAGAVGPGLDAVWLAPDKIGRVLHNLVDNALQHTPPGGEVEVRAAAEGGWAVVRVRDTGEGIPAAELPRVFDRFFRGDASRSRGRVAPGAGRRGGGAGLGLAIARGLVEAHGGSITAESTPGTAGTPGAGTTLTFRLPLKL